MPIRRLVLAGTLFAAMFLTASARADIVVVTTNTDDGSAADCTLRDAITAVSTDTQANGCNPVIVPGSDTIMFAPSLNGQTIQLSLGELVANDPDPLGIVGPGMNDLFLSAGTDSRVFHATSGTVSISGMTIRDGAPTPTAGGVRGGCIYGEGPATALTLTDVHVTNCSASVLGGASVDLFADGGGIGSDGTLDLDHSLVDLNSASVISTGASSDTSVAFARGGGIYTDPNGSLTITDSTISGNIAGASDTGDGEVQATAGLNALNQAQISNSTISGNGALVNQQGTAGATARAIGGLQAQADTGIELSTFANNVADAAGSGVKVSAAGIYTQSDVSIDSSTIAFNGPTSASADGSGLFNDGAGTVTVSNTILADPRGGGKNCNADTFTSGGFNDDHSAAGPSCFQPSAAGDLTVDPLLSGSIARDLGGPTPTIGLEPTSPMIDAGLSTVASDPTEDQRGFTRPVNFSGVPNAAGGIGADIGAFEFQTTCAGQTTPNGTCPGEGDGGDGGGGGAANPPPVPTAPTGPTGQRATALKKCKKLTGKAKATKRKKCTKRAKRLPV